MKQAMIKRVDEHGRFIVPQRYMKQLAIDHGDDVYVVLEEGCIKIYPIGNEKEADNDGTKTI